jgi:hypothetical protein
VTDRSPTWRRPRVAGAPTRRTTTLAAFALVASVSLGSAFAAGPVAADEPTRNAARALASEGDAFYAKQDYEHAVDRFARAYALVGAPTIGVRWARSLAKLGRLIDAEEHYVATVRTHLAPDAPDAFRAAVTEATQELADLRARIPKLEIVRPGGVGAVRLDGKPVPDALIGVARSVDPGAHVVEGDGAARESVSVVEGQSARVVLKRSGEAASSPGNLRKTAGFVAVGVGGVGIVVGAVGGILALQDKAVLDKYCTDGACPANNADNIDKYHTAGTISTIGFVAGGVVLAAGVVLLVTAKPAQARNLGAFVANGGPLRFRF